VGKRLLQPVHDTGRALRRCGGPRLPAALQRQRSPVMTGTQLIPPGVAATLAAMTAAQVLEVETQRPALSGSESGSPAFVATWRCKRQQPLHSKAAHKQRPHQQRAHRPPQAAGAIRCMGQWRAPTPMHTCTGRSCPARARSAAARCPPVAPEHMVCQSQSHARFKAPPTGDH